MILHSGAPGEREQRLAGTLAFFGVPVELLSVSELDTESRQGYAVLASAESLLLASREVGDLPRLFRGAGAVYVYGADSAEVSAQAVMLLLPGSGASISRLTQEPQQVKVSKQARSVTGPMTGLAVTLSPATSDHALTLSATVNSSFTPVISVGGRAAFAAWDWQGVPVYFCASSEIVDLEAPVRGNFYDVKTNFLSAVPLVMFITRVFGSVMWRPQETGACLIIDDPLLKQRYGFCDFGRLRELMKQYGFTTNIAFIPWNWRRTTRAGSAFFRRERAHFSVSVHGCDHIAAEFGTTSVDALDHKARLAQARMRKHQERTNIQHDPVMVFPQGVFSSPCPEVLKRNGFVAAVNTEIAPVDGVVTRLRDVWDVAIMSYGSFPIYTRRYAFHGIENFAFDMLLGKPCFIVAHHDFFKDDGASLVALVKQLAGLEGQLCWRSPREVIRRAYRRRAVDGQQQIEMYASELAIAAGAGEVHVRKREDDMGSVSGVLGDGHDMVWRSENGLLEFTARRPAQGERLLSVFYAAHAERAVKGRSMQYEMAVAVRRLLSEIRDEYAQKVRLGRAS